MSGGGGVRRAVRRMATFLGVIAVLTASQSSPAMAQEAPFWGAVWISPNVLTPKSPSDLLTVTYDGLRNHQTFDRRVEAWTNVPSHIFRASYGCAPEQVEVVVNAEFDRQEAEAQALRFAHVLGQLPLGNRAAIQELVIHAGYHEQGAAGGYNTLTIHTGYADEHVRFLEEIFVHEAAHASLDWVFDGAVDQSAWSTAAAADGRFISQYVSDFPDREDVAESYGAFLVTEAAKTNKALRKKAKRIRVAIPHRLNFFRALGPEFGLSRETCPSSGGVSRSTTTAWPATT